MGARRPPFRQQKCIAFCWPITMNVKTTDWEDFHQVYEVDILALRLDRWRDASRVERARNLVQTLSHGW